MKIQQPGRYDLAVEWNRHGGVKVNPYLSGLDPLYLQGVPLWLF